MFLKTNPEFILIQREEWEEEQEVRRQEKEEAKKLTNCIISRLTCRQQAVLSERSKGKTFKEIADELGVSERTIHYDWVEIVDVAWSIIDEVQ